MAVVEKFKNTPSQLQRGLSLDAMARGGEGQQPRFSRLMSVTGGERGGQIVAGWPSWLVSVAGEAISGWIPSKADSYERLEKIGQGAYSSVYKARDIETNKIVALKKVRFANMDPESIRFMVKEIIILRRLDHSNVMKLEGLAATPGIKLTEAQIKCYMQQLLNGLDHCHSRGILHRDIKGANLLIDNNGNLKIADFGLATFSRADEKQPMTSRVVTLWYRPPELLLGCTDYGAAVDLWSAGCILAELFAGKPIMPGRTEVEQLHKIFKLCGSPSEEYWKRSKLPHATIFKPQRPYNRSIRETFKDFPASTLAFLEVLLATEPELRGTASSALQSEYRPSKEFDIKLQNDESIRYFPDCGKVRGNNSFGKVSRESTAILDPEFNVGLQPSIENRQWQLNTKSFIEVNRTGCPTEPPKGMPRNVYSHSGLSMHRGNFGSSRIMNRNKIPSIKAGARQFGAAELSRFSNSVAVKGYAPNKNRIHCSEPLIPPGPGENLDEMLKEHERLMPYADRQARSEKTYNSEK
ncbi:putative serine/threonine-protein kinase [Hibiscus syriacus]|uniref:Serine/threonine-protein kinase n=1 Tax=Hibiscus syriacus TaxID=106335 RepID=A0A6A2Z784_HIBSY|nr:putative serine/threonine-protein kinase [Hibiscus syriacus]